MDQLFGVPGRVLLGRDRRRLGGGGVSGDEAQALDIGQGLAEHDVGVADALGAQRLAGRAPRLGEVGMETLDVEWAQRLSACSLRDHS